MRHLVLALVLALPLAAFGGPKVPEKQLVQLPPEVLTAFQPQADTIKSTDSEIVAAQAKVDAMATEKAASKEGIGAAKSSVTDAKAGVTAARDEKQAAVDAAEAKVNQSKASLNEAKQQVKLAKEAVKAAKAGLKEAKLNQKNAVAQAGVEVDAAKAEVGEAKEEKAGAVARMAAAKAHVAWLRARRDLEAATLEHKRAEAVAANGMDIDVGAFKEAVDKARLNVDAKKVAWDQAEAAAPAE